ncbi:glutaminase [Clostridium tetanomorphum]|uniref:Glutaminase n=1 Tax=Clostridium tetanomorphum TaxID=1553 RepID=A0A923EDL9_CLOTT|nr:glutaminase A [Clostridium tetanomorphum]KAJ51679.1 glutaminase [Clostridium tetanomorphum DSM 665]KAJ51959.1 glutaminase [Clostridium tetanomorphum DSM 665]MBC2398688.1 glutaminase A [Clostridium tetanomorphum]MBP1864031.1 glutaminase [Clostridium tetanomorphum]NRS84444.1 glutaminase [Clostridium tetanomorphum]
MESVLKSAIESNKKFVKLGEVATYIPELAKGNKEALGACIFDINGNSILEGDYKTKFTIQSVSKVIILICALMDRGMDVVFSKVDKEPSEEPFNSLVKLETKEGHKPLNPFINAGAIVCTSLVSGDNGIEKFSRILNMIKKLSNNENIDVNYSVYNSEKLTGNTNRAIAYYLKGANIVEKDVEDVLDAYFKICSIEMVVEDVAKIASVIANNGVAPWSNERIIPEDVNRVVKAIMTTCGLYDTSGEFCVNVGVPAKSGVGGCIMAVVPNRMGIAVIGPALDNHGNSIGGIKVLEELSRELNLSIF